MLLISDVNGDGSSNLVIYSEHIRTWIVDHNLDGAADQNFTWIGMRADDILPVGAWDGDRVDETGVYLLTTGCTFLAIGSYNLEINPSFNDVPDAILIVGSWDSASWDTLAFLSGNTWTIYPFNTDCYPSNPLKSFQLKYTGISLAIRSLMNE